MMTYRDETLWLAGLLEGEACFTWSGSPAVKLEMTDEDVVRKAGVMMGAGAVTFRVREGRQATYSVQVYGVKAIQVMSRVHEFMGARRKARINELVQRYFDLPPAPRQTSITYLGVLA